jgi:hypothetical protein
MGELISLEVTRAQAIVLNELLGKPDASAKASADLAELAALDALRGALEANLVGEWQEPGYTDVVAAAYDELRTHAREMGALIEATAPNDQTPEDEDANASGPSD